MSQDLRERLGIAADALNKSLARDRLGVSIAMEHRTRMNPAYAPGWFGGVEFTINSLSLLNVALGCDMDTRTGPHLSYASDHERKDGHITGFIVCEGCAPDKAECPVLPADASTPVADGQTASDGTPAPVPDSEVTPS